MRLHDVRSCPRATSAFAGDPTNQIGTGPYKLQEFEVGVQSIHTRNENYWDTGKPYFDEVHIIDFADSDAMINALLADQIDCARTSRRPRSTCSTEPTGTTCSTPPVAAGSRSSWRSIRNRSPTCVSVRRCASSSTVQAMVDQVLGGYGRIANDLFGPLDPAYIGDDLPQREQDIEAAMALLAEAGQATSRSTCSHRTTQPVFRRWHRRSPRWRRRPGITVNAGARRRHVLGRRVPQAHVRHRLLGHRGTSCPGRLEQPADGALPRRSLAAGGLDVHRRLQRRRRRGRPEKRKVITDKMQTELYEEGGLIIPFFQNQLDGYHDAGARVSSSAPTRSTSTTTAAATRTCTSPRSPSTRSHLCPTTGASSGSSGGGCCSASSRCSSSRSSSSPRRRCCRVTRRTAILGRDATEASVNRAARASSGSTVRLLTQYFDWLGGMLTGDPGDSFNARQPILDYIGSRVTNSLFLLVLASVISIPSGLLFWARRRPAERDSTSTRHRRSAMLGLASIARVRDRDALVILFSTIWFARAARSHPDRHGPAVAAPRSDDPADGDVRDRCSPVHVADHPCIADRGDRERLRRDGPPQGRARTHGHVAPRDAELARPGLPGDRAQRRLLRRPA